VLLAGQAVSLPLTGVGVFATLLYDHTGRDISSTLTAGAYYVLSATILPYVAYKPGFVKKLKMHWWKFIFLGIGDVYGTYLQTLAFKYNSVASNQVYSPLLYCVHNKLKLKKICIYKRIKIKI